jgi:hypothetical protein
VSHLVALGLTEYVDKQGEQKTSWRRVGRAWKNKDGSLNVHLEAFPLSGKLQIRKEEPRPDNKPPPAGDGGDIGF